MYHSELYAKVTVDNINLVKPVQVIIKVIPLLANATNNETFSDTSTISKRTCLHSSMAFGGNYLFNAISRFLFAIYIYPVAWPKKKTIPHPLFRAGNISILFLTGGNPPQSGWPCMGNLFTGHFHSLQGNTQVQSECFQKVWSLNGTSWSNGNSGLFRVGLQQTEGQKRGKSTGI